MIDKEKFHHFNYIKKEELSGSMEGMRYMIKKISQGGRQTSGDHMAGASQLYKNAGRQKN